MSYFIASIFRSKIIGQVTSKFTLFGTALQPLMITGKDDFQKFMNFDKDFQWILFKKAIDT